MGHKLRDLTGNVYNRFTVLRTFRKDKTTYCECRCSCGTVKIVEASKLKNGSIKSCGCLRKEKMKNLLKDLIGQKFGRLTVLKRVEDIINSKNKHHTQWLCQCDCGNFIEVRGSNLINGSTKSCGCYFKETHSKHKLSSSRLFCIYDHVKQRCCNTSNDNYKNYGGRGITICDEWLDKDNGFMSFYSWAMQNGYQDSLSIDRIDVNGNYEPDNCRWATAKEQANNTRKNRKIVYNGVIYSSMKIFSEKYNIKYSALQYYVKKGLKIDDIVARLGVHY